MKFKFIIIGALVVLLSYTVWQMMKFEEELRKKRIVKEYLDDESKPLVEKLNNEELRRLANTSDYYFRADGDFFRYLTYKYQTAETTWDTIFYKGVNLGVALPGKYPAEFSLTYEQYLEWLEMIGSMHSNVVRVYTILPPEFYEAFAHYNLKHQDNPLYLMQGVWADIPEEDNYLNKSYSRSLKKEIIDVIDVLHGNAVLPQIRGKAYGIYVTDVSKYVSAILFGREWEPNAVFVTNHDNTVDQFNGDFISVHHGNPMEVWLAEMMDFIVLYETQTYKMQRPVAFVNWLPLDPMYHSSEIIEENHVKEFDNDLEKVDFNNFHSTDLFRPGIFASYHAYPYYPDFIYRESKYTALKAEDGSYDNYRAYLLDLKKNHQGMPLLISEYGIPSSRGNSHISPYGFDQGGHSEFDHAWKNVKLTKDIYHSGCAGAIFFEWADEWFKHNWLVMDFEQPFYDRKNWHNMENPEQNFGILALESKKKTIDGKLDDWGELEFEDNNVAYGFAADPAYFYLTFKFDDFNLEKNNFYVAFDVIGKQQGDHRLPFTDKYFDNGFEFLLSLKDTSYARILVDEPYSIFTDADNQIRPGYASVKNDNGKYIEQYLLSNRRRETLLGEKYPQQKYNRSILHHGNTSKAENSNADWYFDKESGVLEVRLTWHMLNASSPGLMAMLDNNKETPDIEYTKVNNIRIYSFITDEDDKVIAQIPESRPAKFRWEPWGEEPEYQQRLKPIFDSLSDVFRMMDHTDVIIFEEYSEVDQPTICPFYNDHRGAVSLSFENCYLHQYMYATDILEKYNVFATFGLIPEYAMSHGNAYFHDEAGREKRMNMKEFISIENHGHDIAFQDHNGQDNIRETMYDLRADLNQTLQVYYGDRSSSELNTFFNFIHGEVGKTTYSSIYSGVNYTHVPAYSQSQLELNSLLDSHYNAWMILSYKNFFTDLIPEIKKDIMGEFIISDRVLDKQIRLSRNKQFWIAPELDVFKYRKEYLSSKLQYSTHNDLVFITVVNNLDQTIFNHPLTVKYPCDAPFVEIVGSTHDGIYTNRKGYILFHALPGKEVTLKMIW